MGDKGILAGDLVRLEIDAAAVEVDLVRWLLADTHEPTTQGGYAKDLTEL
jgi:hypothetical protein